MFSGVLKPVATRQVTLFMIYSSVFQIGLYGLTDVILNFYFTSLGHSPETIGLLQSFPRIGGLLISIPAGLVASRLGAYRVMFYSTIGMGVALMLPLVWTALPVLVVSRFLLGAFYGAQQVAINPFIGTLVAPKDQPFLFSYHNIITMVATSVGSFIGGYLPTAIVRLFPQAGMDMLAAAQTPQAYRAALTIGMVVMLSSLLALLLVKDTHGASVPVRTRTTDHFKPPWRTLMLFAIPMLFFGFTGGLTFPFYNLFFRNTFHIGDEVVGTILGIGWIGMGVIPMVNPVLDKRYGRSEALFIVLTVAAVAFFGLSIAPSLAISIVAYVIAASARNAMQPLFQPLVMAALPTAAHNMASGIGLVAWNVGWFVATSLSGFLQTGHGFGFLMQIVAVGLIITAASVLLIFRKRPVYQPALQPTDSEAPLL